MEGLPFDVLISIALHLDVRDILRLCRTGQTLKKRLLHREDQMLWRFLWQRDISSQPFINYQAYREALYYDLSTTIDHRCEILSLELIETTPINEMHLLHAAYQGLSSVVNVLLQKLPSKTKREGPLDEMIDYGIVGASAGKHIHMARVLINKDVTKIPFVIAGELIYGFNATLEYFKTILPNEKGGPVGGIYYLAIIFAIFLHQEDAIKGFIDDALKYLDTADFDDILVIAALNGYTKAVSILLAFGADPNRAFGSNISIEILRILVETRRVDMDHLNMVLVNTDDVSFTRFLFDHGANDFENALLRADQRGNLEMIELILERSALYERMLDI